MNWLYFLTGSALWGGSFVAIKFVLNDFSPLTGVLLRLAVALAFFTVYFKIAGVRFRLSKQQMYRIWLAGFFAMALPWYLLFWGERFISPALAGIINGTVPLWVILLNFFYNRKSQRPTPAQIMGLMLGFFGVATIFAPKLKVSYSSQEFFGIVAVTLMAISYAVSGRLTSRILSGESKVSPFANIFHQILSSFVLVSIGAVLLESPWKQSFSDYRSVVSVIYLGIGSSALAYFLIYRLIPIWGLVRASTANYIVPIFSILFQILIYKETPSLSELSGVSLIISGLFLANFSQLKKPA